MTLTYNPSLAKIKVDHHAKSQAQRSNRRVPTDKRTQKHTDANKHIIAPAMRSIKNDKYANYRIANYYLIVITTKHYNKGNKPSAVVKMSRSLQL